MTPQLIVVDEETGEVGYFYSPNQLEEWRLKLYYRTLDMGNPEGDKRIMPNPFGRK